MPSKDSIRFGGFASPEGNKLIESLCESYKVAKSSLLEVLVLGADEQHLNLAPIIESGKQKQREVRPDGRKTRADVMKRLSRIPADKLEALIAQAESIAK